jgi:hypothetical protein
MSLAANSPYAETNVAQTRELVSAEPKGGYLYD